MYNKYLYLTLSIFSLIIILPFIGIFTQLEFEEDVVLNFIENKYILRIIFFSFYQAFISALLSCLIAIPFSLALNRHKQLKIIKLIVSISGFSFVIPSILIVYAFIKLFGKNGFYNNYFNFYEVLGLNSIYGIEAIIIAHILLNAPFASRLFFQNLNNIPNKYYSFSIVYQLRRNMSACSQNIFLDNAILPSSENIAKQLQFYRIEKRC